MARYSEHDRAAIDEIVDRWMQTTGANFSWHSRSTGSLPQRRIPEPVEPADPANPKRDCGAGEEPPTRPGRKRDALPALAKTRQALEKKAGNGDVYAARELRENREH
jgi:hypothetical protein